jgi:hypothetical protein
MVRINRLSTPLLLVALLLSACQPLIQPTAVTPALAVMPTLVPSPTAASVPIPEPQLTLKNVKFTSQALAGNLLGDPATRTIYVLLPPSYATGAKRYPVIYVLPWGDGGSASNAFGFKSAMDTWLQTEPAKEMILVFPDGANSLGGSQFGTSPTIGDYERYITQELVTMIDTDYRTLPTRDSRGITGCSNGGAGSMRLALKYPDVYGAVTTSGDTYDWTLALNTVLSKELTYLHELPKDTEEVIRATPLVAWYIQVAAGAAANPQKPPLYLDMPFRITNGQAEIVPEVAAKIVEQDSAHEARRYMAQPLRLHGILIMQALGDAFNPTPVVRGFDQLLTELGIEHTYTEADAAHCSFPWEAESLAFLSDHLVFTGP